MLNILLNPIRLKVGRDKMYYKALKEIFGISPNNIELYKLALIHRSASVVLSDGMHINNERLEFLGDAVLESIVSDYLFIEFPNKNEGFLTQLRSKIVSRATLNKISLDLGIDKYMVVQHNALNTQKNLFGDALEAMIGAIYLDKGYDYANRLVIDRILVKKFNVRRLLNTETDFKSRAIEWAQKHHRHIAFETKAHNCIGECSPQFCSEVKIDGEVMGLGNGSSKKEAEQFAAKDLIQMHVTGL